VGGGGGAYGHFGVEMTLNLLKEKFFCPHMEKCPKTLS